MKIPSLRFAGLQQVALVKKQPTKNQTKKQKNILSVK